MLASLNPLQNNPVTSLLSNNPLSSLGQTSGQQGGPQSLKDVIDKLSEALTKDGHLDKESPLGKMVGDQINKMNPMAAMLRGTPPGEMVKEALGELIKDKLGDNFGAAADFGLNAGGGAGAGKPDLMSQVLNGLGKASLDDLLSKQGDGTKFSSDDMPMLDKVAQFMDQNPSKFPAPDSGSWKNELKEDNFLDKKETGAFRAALDMLGGQLEQQQNGVADASGGNGLGAPANSGLQPGNALGSPPGNGGNSLTQDLGQLLSGLIQKGLEAEQNGGGANGTNGANGQQNPLFAQHDLQNSLAQAANAIVQTLTGSGNNSLS